VELGACLFLWEHGVASTTRSSPDALPSRISGVCRLHSGPHRSCNVAFLKWGPLQMPEPRTWRHCGGTREWSNGFTDLVPQRTCRLGKSNSNEPSPMFVTCSLIKVLGWVKVAWCCGRGHRKTPKPRSTHQMVLLWAYDSSSASIEPNALKKLNAIRNKTKKQGDKW